MNEGPNAFDLQALLQQWSVQEPKQVQPAQAGASNDSMFITTPADTYVLRISKQHSPAGMRYEHQVLAALAKMNLPFAVPVPLSTIDGATYVSLLQDSVACLVRRLPGEVRQGKNLQQAQSAGEALGRLVCALGQIHLPRGQAHYPPYGDLGSYLPAGYVPQAVILAVHSLDGPTKHDLAKLVGRMEEAIPWLYETLPHQLLHRDYFANNVLMTGEKVSAILDFEFAGEDVRALDFAIGLTWWAMDLDALDDWAVFEAFGRGYKQGGGPLTDAEARALPMLALLRLVTGVTWSLGRFLKGIDSTDRLYVFLCQRALSFADWLARNEEVLVAHAVQWVSD